MNNIKRFIWLFIPALLLALLGQLDWLTQDKAQQPALPSASLLPVTQSSQQGSILPLPPMPFLPPDKVALGERLFHEVKLSQDDSISCASCHALNTGGVDRLRFSQGIRRQVGSINAPTVFNAALNFAQFWDGRADSLETQALMPIENPLEMGATLPEVLKKLADDPHYRREFQRIYPDSGLTAANLADALATFERTLLTYNAPFDHYLHGDKKAISPEAERGYLRFVDLGCASCHQGSGIGGNMFQQFGVMDDYFQGRPARKADQGRFNVTGQEQDRHVFKVPSLRNVAVTAPYFHDGSANTLAEAVKVMGRYQLGKTLSEEDIQLLVAFLHTLTGEWRGRPLL